MASQNATFDGSTLKKNYSPFPAEEHKPGWHPQPHDNRGAITLNWNLASTPSPGVLAKFKPIGTRQVTPKTFMKGFRRGIFIYGHIFEYGPSECNKSKIKCTFSPNGIWFLTCLGVFPLLSSSIRFSMATVAPSHTVFLGQKRKTVAGLPGKGRNNRELMGLSSTLDEATPFKKGKRFNQRCRGRWAGGQRKAA